MNKKELMEIRRRLRAEDSSITQFYGCYVNGLKQIISMFSVSLATMNETESGMYFDLVKKAISGTGVKNLVTIPLKVGGEQQRLLEEARKEGARDGSVRERLYRGIIDSVDMEGNYLILIAYDSYDVPARSASGEMDRESSAAVFSYYICAICPVIDAEAKLAYISQEQEFRSNTVGQTVGAPAAGFMYPSFENRSANTDKVLYYMKNPAEPHDELVEGLFGTQRPMMDLERRDAFREALAEATEGSCEFAAVQSLYQAMRDKTELIKSSETPELETMRPSDIRQILEESGIDEKKAESFAASYSAAVGEDSRVMPSAVMDSSKFQMSSPEVKITVSPELSPLVKMRTIDGKRYILIPADGGVELNGISVF